MFGFPRNIHQKEKGEKAASKNETAAGRQDKDSDNNKVRSQKMDEVGR